MLPSHFTFQAVTSTVLENFSSQKRSKNVWDSSQWLKLYLIMKVNNPRKRLHPLTVSQLNTGTQRQPQHIHPHYLPSDVMEVIIQPVGLTHFTRNWCQYLFILLVFTLSHRWSSQLRACQLKSMIKTGSTVTLLTKQVGLELEVRLKS